MCLFPQVIVVFQLRKLIAGGGSFSAQICALCRLLWALWLSPVLAHFPLPIVVFLCPPLVVSVMVSRFHSSGSLRRGGRCPRDARRDFILRSERRRAWSLFVQDLEKKLKNSSTL